MKRIILIALFAGLIILITSPLFVPKSKKTIDFFYQVFSLPSILDQLSELKKENADLKAKLFSLEANYFFPADDYYAYARVFSLYPFNNKSRLYINAGLNQGIKKGNPVMFSKTVLIGQIINTLDDKSEVITLFDHNFSLPVKIGKNGIDGLLLGGVNPAVGLIDKTKQINVGDQIFSASKDLPYGLLIGKVKSIQEDSTGTFWKAQVLLPYSLSDVFDVYVIKK
jgi:rod shape-determining protein MreC